MGQLRKLGLAVVAGLAFGGVGRCSELISLGSNQQSATLLDIYLHFQKVAADGTPELKELAATYATFVGNYVDAASWYRFVQSGATNRTFLPLPMKRQAVDALEVSRLIGRPRVLIFNEAHILPVTRTLTIQLLPRLKEEGFTHFAMEALDGADEDIRARGYATNRSGMYLQEPLSGEMMREAIRLGFQIVPYEATAQEGSIPERREAAQAQHILDLLKREPNARVVINAGHAHGFKQDNIHGAATMGARLVQALGNDQVVSIDQTFMNAASAQPKSSPYDEAVLLWKKPTAFVITDGNDRPYSAEPNQYEISVFFPPDSLINGRPSWLSLGGLRAPHPVPKSICDGVFPCIVEAIYSAEGSDATAADRVLFRNGSEEAAVYTRDERYRLIPINSAAPDSVQNSGAIHEHPIQK